MTPEQAECAVFGHRLLWNKDVIHCTLCGAQLVKTGDDSLNAIVWTEKGVEAVFNSTGDTLTITDKEFKYTVTFYSLFNFFYPF